MLRQQTNDGDILSGINALKKEIRARDEILDTVVKSISLRELRIPQRSKGQAVSTWGGAPADAAAAQRPSRRCLGVFKDGPARETVVGR